MALKPLGNRFLFAFLNDTAGGRFIERSKGSIVLTNKDDVAQTHFARWGKVLAAGPDCLDIKNGDLVLIEAGRWTMGFKHDGIRINQSDEMSVCAITDDINDTYAY